MPHSPRKPFDTEWSETSSTGGASFIVDTTSLNEMNGRPSSQMFSW